MATAERLAPARPRRGKDGEALRGHRDTILAHGGAHGGPCRPPGFFSSTARSYLSALAPESQTSQHSPLVAAPVAPRLSYSQDQLGILSQLPLSCVYSTNVCGALHKHQAQRCMLELQREHPRAQGVGLGLPHAGYAGVPGFQPFQSIVPLRSFPKRSPVATLYGTGPEQSYSSAILHQALEHPSARGGPELPWPVSSAFWQRLCPPGL